MIFPPAKACVLLSLKGPACQIMPGRLSLLQAVVGSSHLNDCSMLPAERLLLQAVARSNDVANVLGPMAVLTYFHFSIQSCEGCREWPRCSACFHEEPKECQSFASLGQISAVATLNCHDFMGQHKSGFLRQVHPQ